MLTIENVTNASRPPFGSRLAFTGARRILRIARTERCGQDNADVVSCPFVLHKYFRSMDNALVPMRWHRRHELGFAAASDRPLRRAQRRGKSAAFRQALTVSPARSCALVLITGCTQRSYSNDGRTKCRPIPADRNVAPRCFSIPASAGPSFVTSRPSASIRNRETPSSSSSM